MTPDRTFAPEVMAMNLTPYMHSLRDKAVTFAVTRRLLDVNRVGNKLTATIGTDHGHQVTYDQVLVDHGTLPLDGLYFKLKPMSSNEGAVDQAALIDGRKQTIARNAQGAFQLFRIGDAVCARNTYATVYVALRLMKDI